jgi:ankyrin repeat protein
VVHPEALALLLERGSAFDEEIAIGKCPLMEAAEFDQIESARLLLYHVAFVNIAKRQEGMLTLHHDGRSALMYAAANSPLLMIELLLEAGADPYQTDTKGARAVHYLLGYGPERPANATLTPEERSKAIGLLF